MQDFIHYVNFGVIGLFEFNHGLYYGHFASIGRSS